MFKGGSIGKMVIIADDIKRRLIISGGQLLFLLLGWVLGPSPPAGCVVNVIYDAVP